MKEFSKHSNGTDGLSDGKKTEAIGSITGMFAYEGEQSKIPVLESQGSQQVSLRFTGRPWQSRRGAPSVSLKVLSELLTRHGLSLLFPV